MAPAAIYEGKSRMNSRPPRKPPRPPTPPPVPNRARDEELEDEILSRKLSRDDLQELARMSSELVRRTILSGVDVFRDVSRELPKEASQFIHARKEQVLQTFSREFTESLINATMDRFFRILREHRVDVSFRLVRDLPAEKASSPLRSQHVQHSPTSPKEGHQQKNTAHHAPSKPVSGEPRRDGDLNESRSKVSYSEAVSAIAERLAKDVATLRKSSRDKS